MKSWFPSNWSIGSWQPYDPTYLLYEARSAEDRFLFTAKILRLYDTEHDLSSGRFRLFTTADQPHKIELRKSPVDGNQLIRWMGDMVDWIGQHAVSSWSMALTMPTVSDFRVLFSFADIKNAVTFALVWRGE